VAGNEATPLSLLQRLVYDDQGVVRTPAARSPSWPLS